MSSAANSSQFSARELAEVSQLADGTLEPARRAEVEARIAASPELAELYQRELRVVGLMHSARARDRAPERLRSQIAAQRPRARTRARRRVTYGGALAGALGAAAVVLALVLPAGAPGAPSISQAAGLALRGSAQPAPAPDSTNPQKLYTDVEDVYFPNWSSRFGWRAVGQRSDTINGRQAVTMYYTSHGERIAYTIVGAPALKQPAAPVTTLNGTELRTLNLAGRMVVTWRRAGHTCVLSGAGVSVGALRKLAAWKVPGEDR